MPIAATTSMAEAPPQPWEAAVRPSEFGIVPLVLRAVSERYGPTVNEHSDEDYFLAVVNFWLTRMISFWLAELDAVKRGNDFDGPPAAHILEAIYPMKDSQWKGIVNEGLDRKKVLADLPIGRTAVLLNRDNGKIACVLRNRDGGFVHDIALRDKLYAKAREGEFNRPTRVRASSVDGCRRATFFDIMRFEAVEAQSDANPHWAVSAKIGTAIHNLLEDVLDVMPLPSVTEYTVEIPGVFGGKVDGKVTINGEEVLLDWKTVGANDFRQGAKLGKIKKYFAQLSSYAAVEGIKKAVVILVNRDSGAMKELELQLDENYGQSLIRRAEGTMKFVADRKLPPPDGIAENGCFFCKFRRQCDAEEYGGTIQMMLDRSTAPESL